jgi:hypothetical protein
MDARDREAIEELFRKIAEVERRSGPRDAEAEAFIRAKIAADPAAAYYMAQTIVVQEEALNEAEHRIEELERGSQGGMLGGLFGGGRSERHRRYVEPVRRSRQMEGPGAYGQSGGGFLAGAAQTAMGVAGGVLLGNLIGGLFAGDDASAAEDVDPGMEDQDVGMDAAPPEDAGGDFGGFDDF